MCTKNNSFEVKLKIDNNLLILAMELDHIKLTEIKIAFTYNLKKNYRLFGVVVEWCLQSIRYWVQIPFGDGKGFF